MKNMDPNFRKALEEARRYGKIMRESGAHDAIQFHNEIEALEKNGAYADAIRLIEKYRDLLR